MPPSSGGTSLPQESGQSGTDKAASVLVTRLPATTSRKVHTATRTVNRCSQRLSIIYRCISNAAGFPDLPQSLKEPLPHGRGSVGAPYPLTVKSAVLLSLAPTVTC